MLAVRAATPALMRSFAMPLRSFAPPLRQAFPPRAVRAAPAPSLRRAWVRAHGRPRLLSIPLSTRQPHLGAAALPTIASLVPSALANLGVWLMNRNARRPTKVRTSRVDRARPPSGL